MKSMQNGYLMRYLEDTYLLAKTIRIKLHDIALLMNEGVALRHGLDKIDVFQPLTWKYYMNLAGEYHPTDKMMRVVSIDTLEEIEFTKENLIVHTATAEAYQYGTRKYFILLSQYPDQEFLINGILNPANKNEALNAEDGTIVAYRKDLVETNELTLIPELEKHIKLMIARWYNRQFNTSNELYCATFLAQLYNHLPTKIMNLRLRRCHTYEAHSFHVRMFLASHGRLDRYLPYMTLKQSLWLYRNIRYIERNAGRTEQFYTLIQHLLTERGIPIGSYSVRHLDEFSDYLPETTVKITPLNRELNTLSDNRHPVYELLEKEVQDAPDNRSYVDRYRKNILNSLKYSPSASIETKVLGSSMVDLANAVPEPFPVVALREWCSLAFKGLYQAYITFKDPQTSIAYTLSAKDAFFYMQYLTMRREGITLHEIPQFLNMQQRRHPKPTVDDLLSVVDHKNRDLRWIAVDLINNQPNLEICPSVSSFYEHVDAIYQEAFRHWYIVSNVEDYYERALVENMIHRLYEDVRMDYNLGVGSIGEWLTVNNLPEYDYTYDEAGLLIKAIYEAGTGLKIDNARLAKNIQKAMIDLMKELSSYSIQFIREINAEDLLLINWPAVRLGNQRMKSSAVRHTPIDVLVYDRHGKANNGINTKCHPLQDAGVVRFHGDIAQSLHYDPVIDASFTLKAELTTAVLDSSYTVEVTYPGQNTVLDNSVSLPGFTLFEQLSESQKKKIKSIY